MGAVQRRVYAPPTYARARDDEDDAPPRRQTFIFGVMFVVIASFSGVMWSVYNGGEIPRIAAPEGDYKVRPPPGQETRPVDADNTLYDAIEGKQGDRAVSASVAPEAPIDEQELVAEPPPLQGAPRLVGDGPFLAQIAAIQSEAGIEGAWRRVASRAPDLFEGARRDVERADLGQRGVYFRVRAGYFADRANAALFCDRIKLMGQDCIVVAR